MQNRTQPELLIKIMCELMRGGVYTRPLNYFEAKFVTLAFAESFLTGKEVELYGYRPLPEKMQDKIIKANVTNADIIAVNSAHVANIELIRQATIDTMSRKGISVGLIRKEIEWATNHLTTPTVLSPDDAKKLRAAGITCIDLQGSFTSEETEALNDMVFKSNIDAHTAFKIITASTKEKLNAIPIEINHAAYILKNITRELLNKGASVGEIVSDFNSYIAHNSTKYEITNGEEFRQSLNTFYIKNMLNQNIRSDLDREYQQLHREPYKPYLRPLSVVILLKAIDMVDLSLQYYIPDMMLFFFLIYLLRNQIRQLRPVKYLGTLYHLFKPKAENENLSTDAIEFRDEDLETCKLK